MKIERIVSVAFKQRIRFDLYASIGAIMHNILVTSFRVLFYCEILLSVKTYWSSKFRNIDLFDQRLLLAFH